MPSSGNGEINLSLLGPAGAANGARDVRLSVPAKNIYLTLPLTFHNPQPLSIPNLIDSIFADASPAIHLCSHRRRSCF